MNEVGGCFIGEPRTAIVGKLDCGSDPPQQRVQYCGRVQGRKKCVSVNYSFKQEKIKWSNVQEIVSSCNPSETRNETSQPSLPTEHRDWSKDQLPARIWLSHSIFIDVDCQSCQHVLRLFSEVDHLVLYYCPSVCIQQSGLS